MIFKGISCVITLRLNPFVAGSTEHVFSLVTTSSYVLFFYVTLAFLFYYSVHITYYCFTDFVAENRTVKISIPTQSYLKPVMSVFGWIIIHQHLGDNFDWKLPWDDYKAGFGSIDANFWLGLEKVHLLTTYQVYRLRVEVQQRSTNESLHLRLRFSIARV